MTTEAKSLTADQHQELNDAVRSVTAFPDWKAMREAAEDGYVPTLRDDYGSRTFKRAVRMIQAYMRDRGIRFYDGVKVIG